MSTNRLGETTSLPTLNIDQIDRFNETGIIYIPNFYDYQTEIRPIQKTIAEIVNIVGVDAGVFDTPARCDSETFDTGYQELIREDRALGSIVYDAIKQIPEFVQLASCKANQNLASQLRPGSLPGLAAGGWGIRIDNPGEDTFRSPWHQEYPTQFRSLDGLVFWSPLVPITPEIGPVEIAIGSHVEGIIPVKHNAGISSQSGAYAIRIVDESVIDKYQLQSPLTNPGDLLVMDFLTIHRSGVNSSNGSRWSMQTRWLNFYDRAGRQHHWAGPSADLKRIAKVHPGMFEEEQVPTRL